MRALTSGQGESDVGTSSSQEHSEQRRADPAAVVQPCQLAHLGTRTPQTTCSAVAEDAESHSDERAHCCALNMFRNFCSIGVHFLHVLLCERTHLARSPLLLGKPSRAAGAPALTGIGRRCRWRPCLRSVSGADGLPVRQPGKRGPRRPGCTLGRCCHRSTIASPAWHGCLWDHSCAHDMVGMKIFRHYRMLAAAKLLHESNHKRCELSSHFSQVETCRGGKSAEANSSAQNHLPHVSLEMQMNMTPGCITHLVITGTEQQGWAHPKDGCDGCFP